MLVSTEYNNIKKERMFSEYIYEYNFPIFHFQESQNHPHNRRVTILLQIYIKIKMTIMHIVIN